MINLIYSTLIVSWTILKKWQEQHIAEYMSEIILYLAGAEEYALVSIW
jgi:hypothetical protein